MQATLRPWEKGETRFWILMTKPRGYKSNTEALSGPQDQCDPGNREKRTLKNIEIADVRKKILPEGEMQTYQIA